MRDTRDRTGEAQAYGVGRHVKFGVIHPLGDRILLRLSGKRVGNEPSDDQPRQAVIAIRKMQIVAVVIAHPAAVRRTRTEAREAGPSVLECSPSADGVQPGHSVDAAVLVLMISGMTPGCTFAYFNR